MTVKKVVFSFIGTFLLLSSLAAKVPGVMILIVFLLPVFVFLLGLCKCEECGKSYGVFLQNLDLRTGKCLSCSKKTQEDP